MMEFSPLASHPTCTHREITAYNVAATGEPMAFWSCAQCGRRFEPTQPSPDQMGQHAYPPESAAEPGDADDD